MLPAPAAQSAGMCLRALSNNDLQVYLLISEQHVTRWLSEYIAKDGVADSQIQQALWFNVRKNIMIQNVLAKRLL